MKAFAYYYICFFKSSFFEELISRVVTSLIKNFFNYFINFNNTLFIEPTNHERTNYKQI